MVDLRSGVLNRDSDQDALAELFIAELADTDYQGEIAQDIGTRLVLATDNSIHQRLPLAVFFPRSTADVVCILRLLGEPRFRKLPLAARGGGTGANGQSLTNGFVLDCSKYMRSVAPVDAARQTVWVEPGVVLDTLNAEVSAHQLTFAPRISPSSRATIGGMIGTDAAGIGKLRHGRMHRHVLRVRCVLIGGQVLELTRQVSPAPAMTAEHAEDVDPVRQLATHVKGLLCTTAGNCIPELQTPTSAIDLAGYNLPAVVSEWPDRLNLAALLCGAEGSLAVVTACQLQLIPRPTQRILALISYPSLAAALQHRQTLLDFLTPNAIEFLDQHLLALARDVHAYALLLTSLALEDQPAGALNIVEFVGEEAAWLLANQADALSAIAGQSGVLAVQLIATEDKIAQAWQLRKDAVGLLSRRTVDTRRPVPFMEDAAVPPEAFADFVLAVTQLLDEQQLTYGCYGHLDAGCLHVRPALDLTLGEDQARLTHLLQAMQRLVQQYGGVLWGEHGKGFRSAGLPQSLGALYPVWQGIKKRFDPHNQLNPGKLVTPSNEAALVAPLDDLRADFERGIDSAATTAYAAALRCNGNGQCFTVAEQAIICPSFKASQDRRMSPKGRAALLREWLRLGQPVEGAIVTAIEQSLSACLGCKACQHQCPLEVDIPAMKAAFYARYYQAHARPTQHRLLQHFEGGLQALVRWPSLVGLFNWGIRPWLSALFDWVDLPSVCRVSLSNVVRRGKLWHWPAAEDTGKPVVTILPDVITLAYRPTVLSAFCQLLHKMGHGVTILPTFQTQKPRLDLGDSATAKAALTAQMQALQASLQQCPDQPKSVVICEPMLASCWRDEYVKLGLTLPCAVASMADCLMALAPLPLRRKPETLYRVLPHCFEQHPQQLNQWPQVLEQWGVSTLATGVGCCGMAGLYGHQRANQATSKRIFQQSWGAHFTEDAEQVLVTGFSCHCQVKRCTGQTVLHPVELLATLVRVNDAI